MEIGGKRLVLDPLRPFTSLFPRWAGQAPAELAGRKGFALIVSGGGSKGALGGAVMARLFRRDIWPGGYFGTSAGGLLAAIGAMHHREPGLGDRIERICTDLQVKRTRLPGSQFRMLRDLVEHLLREHVPSDLRMDQIEVPVGIAACNASENGEIVVFDNRSSELVRDVLRATTGLPTTNARLGGKRYIDPGMAANLPLEAVVAAGFRQGIVVDHSNFCGSADRPGLLRDLQYQFALGTRSGTERLLELYRPRLALAVIRPSLPLIPMHDFSKTGLLWQLGDHLGELLTANNIDVAGNVVPGRVEPANPRGSLDRPPRRRWRPSSAA